MANRNPKGPGRSVDEHGSSLPSYTTLAGRLTEGISYHVARGRLHLSGEGDMPSFDLPMRAPWYAMRERITSLFVDPAITSIGTYAFVGCAFRSVSLPEGILSVGMGAFRGCFALKRITLPASLSSLGTLAFLDCTSLVSVTIKGGAPLTLGERAFLGCRALERLTLPATLKSLGKDAFLGCGRLKTLSFFGDEEHYGTVLRAKLGTGHPYRIRAVRSFFHKKTLQKRKKRQKEDFIELLPASVARESAPSDGAFFYRITERGELQVFGRIPDYMTPLSAPWCADAELIRSVTLMEGCDRVGRYAFAGLHALRVANLIGAREIGEGAFLDCAELVGITLSPSLHTVGFDSFQGCPYLFLLDFIGGRTAGERALAAITGKNPLLAERLLLRSLPDGEAATPLALFSEGEPLWRFDEKTGTLTVTAGEIPDFAGPNYTPWFSLAGKIRHLVVGGGVRKIGAHAFASLFSLESAVIAAPEVGPFAFASDSSLSSLILLGTVSSLGDFAFAGCSSLETVSLGLSLSKLPRGIFSDCPSLSTLYLSPLMARLHKEALDPGNRVRHLNLFSIQFTASRGLSARKKSTSVRIGLLPVAPANIRCLFATGRSDTALPQSVEKSREHSSSALNSYRRAVEETVLCKKTLGRRFTELGHTLDTLLPLSDAFTARPSQKAMARLPKEEAAAWKEKIKKAEALKRSLLSSLKNLSHDLSSLNSARRLHASAALSYEKSANGTRKTAEVLLPYRPHLLFPILDALPPLTEVEAAPLRPSANVRPYRPKRLFDRLLGRNTEPDFERPVPALPSATPLPVRTLMTTLSPDLTLPKLAPLPEATVYSPAEAAYILGTRKSVLELLAMAEGNYFSVLKEHLDTLYRLSYENKTLLPER